MAKNNRKYQNPMVDVKNLPIEDEFEDFGYDVQNAKRYTVRSKRQAKFKDYDEYLDWVKITSKGANRSLFLYLRSDASRISIKSPQAADILWQF